MESWHQFLNLQHEQKREGKTMEHFLKVGTSCEETFTMRDVRETPVITVRALPSALLRIFIPE